MRLSYKYAHHSRIKMVVASEVISGCTLIVQLHLPRNKWRYAFFQQHEASTKVK